MNNSYSSIATFKQCPYKYKLIYLDEHYIDDSSLVLEFGTLVHATEENIGNQLKDNNKVDYVQVEKDFISGVENLRDSYLDAFYIPDKVGRTYDGKYRYYLNNSLHRLEKRIRNENLEIVGLEKEFYLTYKEYTFHGFIDRLLKKGDTYIIEDIKTYSQPMLGKDLKTPLQCVIYSLAVKQMFGENIKIECHYDLPLCDVVQNVDPDFLDQGIKELDNLLAKMEKSDFEPNPTALCHWCVFSETYPVEIKEARGLCPYYCIWVPDDRRTRPNIPWQGKEKHQQILENFQKNLKK